MGIDQGISRAQFLKGLAVMGGAAAGSAAFAGIAGASEASGSASGSASASASGAASASASAVGSASTSASGSASAAASTPTGEWDDEADVIICGCGTAGAPAAIEACDAGSDVLIVEKQDWIGGCLRRCAGGFLAAGTSVQEKLGVEATPDMLAEYLIACAGDYGDEELIHTFTENAAKDFDWIITDLGGEPLDEWDFVKPENDDEGYSIYIAPGLNLGGTPIYFEDYDLDDDEVPYCHWFKPNPDDTDPGDRYYSDYSETGLGEGLGGTGLWKTMEDNLTSRNIRIQTETELAGLILDDEGAVIGVKAMVDGQVKRYKAHQGVVIATGSFVNDVDLYENFTANKWQEATTVEMTNGGYLPSQSDGAGVKAALKAGAAPRFIFQGNNGGIRINTTAQVIDTYGEVIPRLYASSRAVGGLFSDVYPMCGSYVATSFVFGRIAGQNVCQLDRWDA